MSAPIDDLLYGGDDSGDEDDMNVAAVPMPAFGAAAPLLPVGAAPLAAPGALGAKPLAAVGTVLSAPVGGPVGAPASVVGSVPLGSAGLSAKPVVAAPLAAAAVAPTPAAPAAATAIRAPPAVTGAAAAAPAPAPKQTPGSGQQMFQQMFALLKQMLSPEQYATFYTEMRNGNGNDIKSIVDIIKRIAGDAMFSSLIQKLDLTRSFPTATPAPAATAVKSEPQSAAAVATPAVATATPVAAASLASGAPIAAPSVLASGPMSAAQTPAAAAVQRPALVQPAKSPVGLATASDGSSAVAAPVAAASAVKPEPKAPVAAATVAPTATTPSGTSAAGATTTASPATGSKNEQQLEKIEFAKKLLSHAATCTLTSGVCQVTKCDDVRRVFKHSVSCGGARSCSHCEQLKGLVKYHARECATAASEHCTIPFCDGLRRAYLSAAAALAARSKASLTDASSGAGLHVTSDDDDDNTPLSSAVSKAKKNISAKTKSPKASPTVRATAASPAPAASAAAKKKAAAPAPASKPSTPATTTTTSTTSAAASGAKPAPAKPAVTANMTVEYGRLLQLILHVQKCTASVCPVGAECAEAKTLLREINSPNAPPRAKTYKQVYSHYKVCLAKNNTGNCPMCKIGLRPILPAPSATESSPLASPAVASSSAASASASVTSPSAAASSSKRSNSTVTPSPRSPSKKQRTGGSSTSRVKAAPTLPDPAAQSSSASDAPGHDLTQASVADIRKEADVLTHTGMDLSTERRTMVTDSALRRRSAAAPVELLACKKEEWLETDLFNSSTLRREMAAAARRSGVSLGAHASDVMAYALHEYLKQVVEEMVQVAQQRGDVAAQALEHARKPLDARKGVHVTSTDILRVSCEDAFTRLRHEDLALRAQLLDDAKREEAAEKERAKKRKKVDRSKLNQEEKDEAEMDIEELAVKDLKDRLLQDDKDGVVRIDGRVNESISGKLTRRLDHQVTIEDAAYWLQNQKPYVPSKLFVRAEAARIVTKSLL